MRPIRSLAAALTAALLLAGCGDTLDDAFGQRAPSEAPSANRDDVLRAVVVAYVDALQAEGVDLIDLSPRVQGIAAVNCRFLVQLGDPTSVAAELAEWCLAGLVALEEEGEG